MKQLGFNSPYEAVNQEVFFHAFDDYLRCRIIGIVKDYNHEAIKTEVYPTILFNNFGTFQQVYFSIRLDKDTGPEKALSTLERIWKENFPDRSFDYFFLDEYYDRQFKSEIKIYTIF